MVAMPIQSFNEGSLKTDGMMFYTKGSEEWLKGDQKTLFSSLTQKRENFEKISEALEAADYGTGDIQYLRNNLHPIDESKFKTPLGIVYVSYAPECQFMKKLYDHAVLIDSFTKNPDKSFYSFPYSYKPETKAKTKTRQENFNPDFFLKKGNDVIVVEIKKQEQIRLDNEYMSRMREEWEHRPAADVD